MDRLTTIRDEYKEVLKDDNKVQKFQNILMRVLDMNKVIPLYDSSELYNTYLLKMAIGNDIFERIRLNITEYNEQDNMYNYMLCKSVYIFKRFFNTLTSFRDEWEKSKDKELFENERYEQIDTTTMPFRDIYNYCKNTGKDEYDQDFKEYIQTNINEQTFKRAYTHVIGDSSDVETIFNMYKLIEKDNRYKYKKDDFLPTFYSFPIKLDFKTTNIDANRKRKENADYPSNERFKNNVFRIAHDRLSTLYGSFIIKGYDEEDSSQEDEHDEEDSSQEDKRYQDPLPTFMYWYKKTPSQTIWHKTDKEPEDIFGGRWELIENSKLTIDNIILEDDSFANTVTFDKDSSEFISGDIYTQQGYIGPNHIIKSLIKSDIVYFKPIKLHNHTKFIDNLQKESTEYSILKHEMHCAKLDRDFNIDIGESSNKQMYDSVLNYKIKINDWFENTGIRQKWVVVDPESDEINKLKNIYHEGETYTDIRKVGDFLTDDYKLTLESKYELIIETSPSYCTPELLTKIKQDGKENLWSYNTNDFLVFTRKGVWEGEDDEEVYVQLSEIRNSKSTYFKLKDIKHTITCQKTGLKDDELYKLKERNTSIYTDLEENLDPRVYPESYFEVIFSNDNLYNGHKLLNIEYDSSYFIWSQVIKYNKHLFSDFSIFSNIFKKDLYNRTKSIGGDMIKINFWNVDMDFNPSTSDLSQDIIFEIMDYHKSEFRRNMLGFRYFFSRCDNTQKDCSIQTTSTLDIFDKDILYIFKKNNKIRKYYWNREEKKWDSKEWGIKNSKSSSTVLQKSFIGEAYAFYSTLESNYAMKSNRVRLYAMRYNNKYIEFFNKIYAVERDCRAKTDSCDGITLRNTSKSMVITMHMINNITPRRWFIRSKEIISELALFAMIDDNLENYQDLLNDITHTFDDQKDGYITNDDTIPDTDGNTLFDKHRGSNSAEYDDFQLGVSKDDKLKNGMSFKIRSYDDFLYLLVEEDTDELVRNITTLCHPLLPEEDLVTLFRNHKINEFSHITFIKSSKNSNTVVVKLKQTANNIREEGTLCYYGSQHSSNQKNFPELGEYLLCFESRKYTVTMNKPDQEDSEIKEDYYHYKKSPSLYGSLGFYFTTDPIKLDTWVETANNGNVHDFSRTFEPDDIDIIDDDTKKIVFRDEKKIRTELEKKKIINEELRIMLHINETPTYFKLLTDGRKLGELVVIEREQSPKKVRDVTVNVLDKNNTQLLEEIGKKIKYDRPLEGMKFSISPQTWKSRSYMQKGELEANDTLRYGPKFEDQWINENDYVTIVYTTIDKSTKTFHIKSHAIPDQPFDQVIKEIYSYAINHDIKEDVSSAEICIYNKNVQDIHIIHDPLQPSKVKGVQNQVYVWQQKGNKISNNTIFGVKIYKEGIFETVNYYVNRSKTDLEMLDFEVEKNVFQANQKLLSLFSLEASFRWMDYIDCDVLKYTSREWDNASWQEDKVKVNGKIEKRAPSKARYSTLNNNIGIEISWGMQHQFLPDLLFNWIHNISDEFIEFFTPDDKTKTKLIRDKEALRKDQSNHFNEESELYTPTIETNAIKLEGYYYNKYVDTYKELQAFNMKEHIYSGGYSDIFLSNYQSNNLHPNEFSYKFHTMGLYFDNILLDLGQIFTSLYTKINTSFPYIPRKIVYNMPTKANENEQTQKSIRHNEVYKNLSVFFGKKGETNEKSDSYGYSSIEPTPSHTIRTHVSWSLPPKCPGVLEVGNYVRGHQRKFSKSDDGKIIMYICYTKEFTRRIPQEGNKNFITPPVSTEHKIPNKPNSILFINGVEMYGYLIGHSNKKKTRMLKEKDEVVINGQNIYFKKDEDEDEPILRKTAYWERALYDLLENIDKVKSMSIKSIINRVKLSLPQAEMLDHNKVLESLLSQEAEIFKYYDEQVIDGNEILYDFDNIDENEKIPFIMTFNENKLIKDGKIVKLDGPVCLLQNFFDKKLYYILNPYKYSYIENFIMGPIEYTNQYFIKVTDTSSQETYIIINQPNPGPWHDKIRAGVINTQASHKPGLNDNVFDNMPYEHTGRRWWSKHNKPYYLSIMSDDYIEKGELHKVDPETRCSNIQEGCKYLLAFHIEKPSDIKTEFICKNCGAFSINSKVINCELCKFPIIAVFNIDSLRQYINNKLISQELQSIQEESKTKLEESNSSLEASESRLSIEKLGFYKYEIYEYLTFENKPWYDSSIPYVKASENQVTIVMDIEHRYQQQEIERIITLKPYKSAEMNKKRWPMFNYGKRWHGVIQQSNIKLIAQQTTNAPQTTDEELSDSERDLERYIRANLVSEGLLFTLFDVWSEDVNVHIGNEKLQYLLKGDNNYNSITIGTYVVEVLNNIIENDIVLKNIWKDVRKHHYIKMDIARTNNMYGDSYILYEEQIILEDYSNTLNDQSKSLYNFYESSGEPQIVIRDYTTNPNIIYDILKYKDRYTRHEISNMLAYYVMVYNSKRNEEYDFMREFMTKYCENEDKIGRMASYENEVDVRLEVDFRLKLLEMNKIFHITHFSNDIIRGKTSPFQSCDSFSITCETSEIDGFDILNFSTSTSMSLKYQTVIKQAEPKFYLQGEKISEVYFQNPLKTTFFKTSRKEEVLVFTYYINYIEKRILPMLPIEEINKIQEDPNYLKDVSTHINYKEFINFALCNKLRKKKATIEFLNIVSQKREFTAPARRSLRSRWEDYLQGENFIFMGETKAIEDYLGSIGQIDTPYGTHNSRDSASKNYFAIPTSVWEKVEPPRDDRIRIPSILKYKKYKNDSLYNLPSEQLELFKRNTKKVELTPDQFYEMEPYKKSDFSVKIEDSEGKWHIYKPNFNYQQNTVIWKLQTFKHYMTKLCEHTFVKGGDAGGTAQAQQKEEYWMHAPKEGPIDDAQGILNKRLQDGQKEVHFNILDSSIDQNYFFTEQRQQAKGNSELKIIIKSHLKSTVKDGEINLDSLKIFKINTDILLPNLKGKKGEPITDIINKIKAFKIVPCTDDLHNYADSLKIQDNSEFTITKTVYDEIIASIKLNDETLLQNNQLGTYNDQQIWKSSDGYYIPIFYNYYSANYDFKTISSGLKWKKVSSSSINEVTQQTNKEISIENGMNDKVVQILKEKLGSLSKITGDFTKHKEAGDIEYELLIDEDSWIKINDEIIWQPKEWDQEDIFHSRCGNIIIFERGESVTPPSEEEQNEQSDNVQHLIRKLTDIKKQHPEYDNIAMYENILNSLFYFTKDVVQIDKMFWKRKYIHVNCIKGEWQLLKKSEDRDLEMEIKQGSNFTQAHQFKEKYALSKLFVKETFETVDSKGIKRFEHLMKENIIINKGLFDRITWDTFITAEIVQTLHKNKEKQYNWPATSSAIQLYYNYVILKTNENKDNISLMRNESVSINDIIQNAGIKTRDSQRLPDISLGYLFSKKCQICKRFGFSTRLIGHNCPFLGKTPNSSKYTREPLVKKIDQLKQILIEYRDSEKGDREFMLDDEFDSKLITFKENIDREANKHRVFDIDYKLAALLVMWVFKPDKFAKEDTATRTNVRTSYGCSLERKKCKIDVQNRFLPTCFRFAEEVNQTGEYMNCKKGYGECEFLQESGIAYVKLKDSDMTMNRNYACVVRNEAYNNDLGVVIKDEQFFLETPYKYRPVCENKSVFKDSRQFSFKTAPLSGSFWRFIGLENPSEGKILELSEKSHREFMHFMNQRKAIPLHIIEKWSDKFKKFIERYEISHVVKVKNENRKSEDHYGLATTPVIKDVFELINENIEDIKQRTTQLEKVIDEKDFKVFRTPLKLKNQQLLIIYDEEKYFRYVVNNHSQIPRNSIEHNSKFKMKYSVNVDDDLWKLQHKPIGYLKNEIKTIIYGHIKKDQDPFDTSNENTITQQFHDEFIFEIDYEYYINQGKDRYILSDTISKNETYTRSPASEGINIFNKTALYYEQIDHQPQGVWKVKEGLSDINIKISEKTLSFGDTANVLNLTINDILVLEQDGKFAIILKPKHNVLDHVMNIEVFVNDTESHIIQVYNIHPSNLGTRDFDPPFYNEDFTYLSKSIHPPITFWEYLYSNPDIRLLPPNMSPKSSYIALLSRRICNRKTLTMEKILEHIKCQNMSSYDQYRLHSKIKKKTFSHTLYNEILETKSNQVKLLKYYLQTNDRQTHMWKLGSYYELCSKDINDKFMQLTIGCPYHIMNRYFDKLMHKWGRTSLSGRIHTTPWVYDTIRLRTFEKQYWIEDDVTWNDIVEENPQDEDFQNSATSPIIPSINKYTFSILNNTSADFNKIYLYQIDKSGQFYEKYFAFIDSISYTSDNIEYLLSPLELGNFKLSPSVFTCSLLKHNNTFDPFLTLGRPDFLNAKEMICIWDYSSSCYIREHPEDKLSSQDSLKSLTKSPFSMAIAYGTSSGVVHVQSIPDFGIYTLIGPSDNNEWKNIYTGDIIQEDSQIFLLIPKEPFKEGENCKFMEKSILCEKDCKLCKTAIYFEKTKTRNKTGNKNADFVWKGETRRMKSIVDKARLQISYDKPSFSFKWMINYNFKFNTDAHDKTRDVVDNMIQIVRQKDQSFMSHYTVETTTLTHKLLSEIEEAYLKIRHIHFNDTNQPLYGIFLQYAQDMEVPPARKSEPPPLNMYNDKYEFYRNFSKGLDKHDFVQIGRYTKREEHRYNYIGTGIGIDKKLEFSNQNLLLKWAIHSHSNIITNSAYNTGLVEVEGLKRLLLSKIKDQSGEYGTYKIVHLTLRELKDALGDKKITQTVCIKLDGPTYKVAFPTAGKKKYDPIYIQLQHDVPEFKTSKFPVFTLNDNKKTLIIKDKKVYVSNDDIQLGKQWKYIEPTLEIMFMDIPENITDIDNNITLYQAIQDPTTQFEKGIYTLEPPWISNEMTPDTIIKIMNEDAVLYYKPYINTSDKHIDWRYPICNYFNNTEFSPFEYKKFSNSLELETKDKIGTIEIKNTTNIDTIEIASRTNIRVVVKINPEEIHELHLPIIKSFQKNGDVKFTQENGRTIMEIDQLDTDFNFKSYRVTILNSLVKSSGVIRKVIIDKTNNYTLYIIIKNVYSTMANYYQKEDETARFAMTEREDENNILSMVRIPKIQLNEYNLNSTRISNILRNIDTAEDYQVCVTPAIPCRLFAHFFSMSDMCDRCSKYKSGFEKSADKLVICSSCKTEFNMCHSCSAELVCLQCGQSSLKSQEYNRFIDEIETIMVNGFPPMLKNAKDCISRTKNSTSDRTETSHICNTTPVDIQKELNRIKKESEAYNVTINDNDIERCRNKTKTQLKSLELYHHLDDIILLNKCEDKFEAEENPELDVNYQKSLSADDGDGADDQGGVAEKMQVDSPPLNFVPRSDSDPSDWFQQYSDLFQQH